jgi:uncharacterized protein (TIGR04255 family)
MMAPATIKRPDDLPDFSRPPVHEVVLGIQFGTLEKLQSVHVGLLWSEFRQEFPRVSEHPPISAQFETFGLAQPSEDKIQLSLIERPPVSRYWFIKSDDSELVQLQPDRLLHNWRKQGPRHDYPRYEAISARFKKEVDVVAQFLARNNLGELAINQFEITYVNHIDLGAEISDPRPELHRIFTFWNSSYSDDYLSRIETARIQARYILTDDQGAAYGRLHVDVSPTVHLIDGQPKRDIVLTLTARGKPTSGDVRSAFTALDRGRVAVVKGFASITRPEMHRLWERTDA